MFQFGLRAVFAQGRFLPPHPFLLPWGEGGYVANLV